MSLSLSRCAALALAACTFVPSPTLLAEPFPFVLPWDDATPGITNLSGMLEKPAGKLGFVTARDGHLFTGDKRIRFFGVNMAFGGNFPTHADAEKVAARMAKFGINCVRFHHMDTATAPSGIVQKDKKTLDPENLDRLDYFIAQLKQHGIFTNLNLHVGLEYPGFQKWEGASSYFKGVDNYFTPFIEQQQAFARALLTHVNPYTKLAYTADPAVALIEINNENGLMMEWNNRTLDAMPDPYATEFTKLWNAWVGKKYKTFEQLASSWREGEEPLGGELLDGTKPWTLEQQEGAKATLETLLTPEGDTTAKLKVEKTGPQPWHVQLTKPGLKLEKGKTYTATFRARSTQPRKISVSLTQYHAPWKVLASRPVELKPEWQTVSLAMTPSETDDNSRISFGNLGEPGAEMTLENISLKSGGIVGLREGEKLGSVGWVKKGDSARRTTEVLKDWNRFLLDTETAYWTGMSKFIKSELGAKAPVLGSATGFSPWLVQSQLDVVDAHAYWQHPHFPGKQWDINDWEVKNESMAGRPDGGTLPGLALRRVAGKPFIVTEYNHSSPNTYSAEAFLEVCAVASLQDWDGVFAFAYSHRLNEWDTKKFGSFFDIDQHPTKMATLPAALSLFYRAEIASKQAPHIASVTMEEAIEAIRTGGGSWVSAKNHGIKPEETFQHPIAFGLRQKGSTPPSLKGAPAKADGKIQELVWDTTSHRMLVETNKSAFAVGSMKAGDELQVGGMRIKAGKTQQNWATITATVVKGDDLPSAKQILVTATGMVENTGTVWKNAEKTTVGRDWGKAPSLVEGIGATLTFPTTAKTLKAWALDERGQRRQDVPIKVEKGLAMLELSPEHKTLWWEVGAE